MSFLSLFWTETRKIWNLSIIYSVRSWPGWALPGEDVFARIRVDHGAKLRDNNLVCLDVSLIGVALQKLTSVSHLTWNSNIRTLNIFSSTMDNWQSTVKWCWRFIKVWPLLKVKLWMSDKPSNQWLYSELPTEKSPGPFLSRVPCSQEGTDPAGQRLQTPLLMGFKSILNTEALWKQSNQKVHCGVVEHFYLTTHLGFGLLWSDQKVVNS